MYCKNCGEFMNNNQAVCLKCGVKTGAGKNYCQNCGAQVSQGAHYCLKCGSAIDCSNDKVGEYDKILIAILCFFFGCLGVHNFMLGETRKGIIKIVFSFCCGISWIFALIDFIKILTDEYKIDANKYF